MTGLFITVEGIDGAGKSTQLASLKQFLERRGDRVVVTREPGGTDIGEALRSLVLSASEPMHPETEALLIFAARREHLARVILPALARGETVLCDRFTDATYAYQGYGSGVDLGKIAQLERWVQGPVQPDVTILLDVPVEVGKQRASSDREADRFERERAEFFERVRTGYLERAQQEPQRFVVVDASRSPEEVRRLVEEYLRTH